MTTIDANAPQLTSCFGVVPSADVLFGRKAGLLFLVGFMTVDIGETTADVAAVLTSRVGNRFCLLGDTVARRAKIGDVFINDAQSFVHDRTVASFQMIGKSLGDGALDVGGKRW